MIPAAFVQEWAQIVPWQGLDQVEHDLVLSRAMVELFSDEYLAKTLALRGGTALQKLIFPSPRRFSEDIDLVQIVEVPQAKEMFQRIRGVLEPWLGKAKSKQKGNISTLSFPFETEIQPVVKRKLKVEIQCREHFTVLGLEPREFTVESDWYQGSAEVPVYQLDELMGTKLRALYQRKKGRDLFDLWIVLRDLDVNAERILQCFRRYMEVGSEKPVVTPRQIIANVEAKLEDPRFVADMAALLPAEESFEGEPAWELILEKLFGEEP